MRGRIDAPVDRWSGRIRTKESGKVPINRVSSEAKPPQQQQLEEEEEHFHLNGTCLVFHVKILIITTVATQE